MAVSEYKRLWRRTKAVMEDGGGRYIYIEREREQSGKGRRLCRTPSPVMIWAFSENDGSG